MKGIFLIEAKWNEIESTDSEGRRVKEWFIVSPVGVFQIYSCYICQINDGKYRIKSGRMGISYRKPWLFDNILDAQNALIRLVNGDTRESELPPKEEY